MISDIKPDIESAKFEITRLENENAQLKEQIKSIRGARRCPEDIKYIRQLECERDECAIVIANFARNKNVDLADICCKADELINQLKIEQQIKGVEDALKAIPETRYGNWKRVYVLKYLIDIKKQLRKGGEL